MEFCELSVHLVCGSKDCSVRPLRLIISNPVKRWSWHLKREDLPVISELSECLSRIPDRLKKDGLDVEKEISESACRLEISQYELLECLKSVSRRDTGKSPEEPLPLEEGENKACFTFDFRRKRLCENKMRTRVSTLSKNEHLDFALEPNLAEQLSKLLEALSTARESFRRKEKLWEDDSHEEVMRRARDLQEGCLIYLHYAHPIWMEVSNARGRVCFVMETGYHRPREKLEELHRRFLAEECGYGLSCRTSSESDSEHSGYAEDYAGKGRSAKRPVDAGEGDNPDRPVLLDPVPDSGSDPEKRKKKKCSSPSAND